MLLSQPTIGLSPPRLDSSSGMKEKNLLIECVSVWSLKWDCQGLILMPLAFVWISVCISLSGYSSISSVYSEAELCQSQRTEWFMRINVKTDMAHRKERDNPCFLLLIIA